MWPKKEVKRIYKEKDFDMKEEDGDPDKTLFAREKTRSTYEKIVFCALILLLYLLWVYVVQDKLIEYCNWA